MGRQSESGGIWVNGRRPKSKKEVREAVAADPAGVAFEYVEIFSTGVDEAATAWSLLEGEDFIFVGPDPYTKRNFYGTITRTKAGLKVT